MWTWVIMVGGYAFSLFFFHILGGIDSAADAIQSWGRSSAERALASLHAANQPIPGTGPGSSASPP